MAAKPKPNPVASSTPVEGRPGVVQDWTADGQPYGQPHARQSADLDSGFSAPVTKPKGTQAGHAVTNNDNHTKPVSPAQKQAEAKRPAVGNDKAAAKKANGPSWNNGYTN